MTEDDKAKYGRWGWGLFLLGWLPILTGNVGAVLIGAVMILLGIGLLIAADKVFPHR